MRGQRLLARACFCVRSVSLIVLALKCIRPQLPCAIHMLRVRVAPRAMVGSEQILMSDAAYRYIGSFGVYQAFYVRQYLHDFSTSDIG